MAARKEDLFREALGDTLPAMPPGAQHLLDLLSKHNVNPAPPTPHPCCLYPLMIDELILIFTR